MGRNFRATRRYFSMIAGNSADTPLIFLETPMRRCGELLFRIEIDCLQGKAVILADILHKKAGIFSDTVAEKGVPVLRLQCSSPMVITFPEAPSIAMAIPWRSSLASNGSTMFLRSEETISEKNQSS